MKFLVSLKFKCAAAFVVLFFFCFAAVSQTENNGLVKWLSFKEAQEKNKVQEKPFIIDLYTDWCGWCKHMMRTTYSNENIAAYINTHFYPIKFDAEGKDTIEYNGVIYKPTSSAPRTPHELALKFLGSSLSYPSTMFVTNQFQYNLLSQGYLEDKKIEPLLVFFVENAWKNVPYEDFGLHFNHTFYDTAYKKGSVKRIAIDQLETQQKKKPKKTLVLLNSAFCNTGKVMSATTFNDTSLVNYLNSKYNFCEFDVNRNDSIVFKGVKYGQVMAGNFPVHSLALKLSNNAFSLPTLCLLDEDLNTIQIIPFYLSPQTLKPLLHYFGSDLHKVKPYADFLKDFNTPAKKSK
jgi:thioredoxin-related protein